ncbi:fumarylacetoacetate hydrolase family protein [Puia sp. P3]|uniref:fumarylacetoacetate hydrolase family protein n=1 Tax=Puia sp. P3 TaxID=3423952 RepID=UPI003D665039
MKLIRHGELNNEKTGIILDNISYDTSAFGEDYNERFFETDGLNRLKIWVMKNLGALPALPGGVRLGSPIARPSKIVCIGLNYVDHARETGATPPPEPVIFMKSTTALIGPNDNIVIPKNSKKTDWEVELAVVIGRRASYVTEAEAMSYVAGYCLHNDVSEREFQIERSGTGTRARAVIRSLRWAPGWRRPTRWETCTICGCG